MGRLVHRLVRIAGLLLVACLLAAGGARAAEPALTRSLGQASDAKACLNCHDDPVVTGILHTAHAVKGDARTGMAEQGCQSCHGESAAHMVKPADGQPRALPGVVYAGAHASPVADRNKLCLGCHETAAADHWQGSAHASADIACSSCHASHPAQDPVRAKTTQAPICFTCHAEQRAANLRPSHHPVIEGVMGCADCHNPHGSDGPHLIKTATINDTCLNCHDEKRGPFLFEHAPVQEQCTICHTPHGSVQVRLLKQRAALSVPELPRRIPAQQPAVQRRQPAGRGAALAADCAARLPQLPQRDPRLQPPLGHQALTMRTRTPLLVLMGLALPLAARAADDFDLGEPAEAPKPPSVAYTNRFEVGAGYQSLSSYYFARYGGNPGQRPVPDRRRRRATAATPGIPAAPGSGARPRQVFGFDRLSFAAHVGEQGLVACRPVLRFLHAASTATTPGRRSTAPAPMS